MQARFTPVMQAAPVASAAPGDAAPDPASSPPGPAIPSYVRNIALAEALAKYNARSDYPYEVLGLRSQIVSRFFPQLESTEEGVI